MLHINANILHTTRLPHEIITSKLLTNWKLMDYMLVLEISIVGFESANRKSNVFTRILGTCLLIYN